MKKEAVEIKSLTNGWIGAHLAERADAFGREIILDTLNFVHYTLSKASADMGMPSWKSLSTERLSGEGGKTR